MANAKIYPAGLKYSRKYNKFFTKIKPDLIDCYRIIAKRYYKHDDFESFYEMLGDGKFDITKAPEMCDYADDLISSSLRAFDKADEKERILIKCIYIEAAEVRAFLEFPKILIKNKII